MAAVIVNYLFHFAFVFGSMLLFFAPFASVFYWQHRDTIRAKKPGFNQFMELFFQSTASNWLVFWWAFSEAIVWFIIPEFLLALLFFMRIKRKRQLLKYDILGTTAGTIIGLALNLSEKVLLATPYIFPGMISHVRDWYETMGIWGLLNQPFSGVPYKVFVAEVHDFAIPLVLFVIVAVAVRLFRYVVIYVVLQILYPMVTMFVRRHYGWLFVGGIAIFTLMLMKVSAIYQFS